MPDRLSRAVSALACSSFAYRFLYRRFLSLVKDLAVPVAGMAVVGYLSLSAYLSELLMYISSGDPRSASLALGSLAAGIFISMFCASVAVSAVVNLVFERAAGRRWNAFRAGRQEWRLYAAYLRFLLLVTGVVSADYLVGIFLLPLFTSSGSVIAGVCVLIGVAGIVLLWAGVGFLIAPVVARTTGSVLRKALHNGRVDIARNVVLTVLLLLPALVIEVAGEYLLRKGQGPSRLTTDLPIAALARDLQHRLLEFISLSALSVFVMVVLFTAASIYRYRDRMLVSDVAEASAAGVTKLDSAPV